MKTYYYQGREIRKSNRDYTFAWLGKEGRAISMSNDKSRLLKEREKAILDWYRLYQDAIAKNDTKWIDYYRKGYERLKESEVVEVEFKEK